MQRPDGNAAADGLRVKAAAVASRAETKLQGPLPQEQLNMREDSSAALLNPPVKNPWRKVPIPDSWTLRSQFSPGSAFFPSSYLGGVVVGALVAFPAASVDPGDARQTQLALIDLQGLVFHHAPSRQSRLQSANIPLTAKTDPENKRQERKEVINQSSAEFEESKY